jgi:hypothetical protein
VILHHEIVIVGVVDNASCDWKITVMMSFVLAYHVFVELFDMNVVVHVSTGVSLSIFIITEFFVASVLFNLSTE